MPYKPPYAITAEIQFALGEVIRLIGQLEGYQLLAGNLQLRRQNKIKSLHSSLAIEGNRLSQEQVTAILEGKPVIGPPRDIQEVKNAISVYDSVGNLLSGQEDDLLSAHGTLMQALIDDAGRYRNSGVGVVDGDRVIHIAPPARQVPRLMGDLFDYLVNYQEDTVVKSCVFHYEFEFIHPFSDGNGRMGRLWQTVILKERYPVLQYVPLENIVHSRQQDYYDALRHSQSVGNSNPFIIYMLAAMRTALEEQLQEANIQHSPSDRLSAFREHFGTRPFVRKDYQHYHKNISPATATRDLRSGVDNGRLTKSGGHADASYQFA
ncbi:hypothetical protein LEM8419_02640 [Neolewinella maritima]|uniref:Fido domain-containing protein n=1 Tax=Neolewinella maritima TaxID=1383882 RepID=A0ABM9B3H8_9BACT|nr:Fic family protein [Neolewinella maritima]CAH1001734.1 hypothetical protein LEM8419_02640 [Neolewinella maritima]